MTINQLERCEGYQMLRSLADRNIEHGWGAKQVNPTFEWTVERAKHYSEKLDIPVNDILISWVNACNYSFVNFFQDANQPKIEEGHTRVFENVDGLMKAIGEREFRCPSCNGISTNPYECNSGEEMEKGKECDWKVYGLFGALGKGTYVYIKDHLKGETIFTPIAWEEVIA